MMEATLLDTDVFSFFFKDDPRRAPYASEVSGKQLCLAFQSVAELKLWTIVRRWGRKRVERLEDSLRQFVILPYDAAMADRWAAIGAHRRSVGREIACGDCWIAAAALRHGISLVTHNRDHFADIPGLVVISH